MRYANCLRIKSESDAIAATDSKKSRLMLSRKEVNELLLYERVSQRFFHVTKLKIRIKGEIPWNGLKFL
ncbi:hypothetical protein DSECCO2_80470 [anaerobic digester metagenome]